MGENKIKQAGAATRAIVSRIAATQRLLSTEVLKAQGLEHLRENVQDIEVFIDSAKIKSKVIQHVRNILSNQFGEENK